MSADAGEAGRRRVGGGPHPRAIGQGLIVRALAGETLVYDTRRHRMHCLGPLLARIWKACSGRRSSAQIAARLSSVANPVEESAVELAVARLRRAHLVEREPRRNGGDRRSTPSSRREALRRAAGLAGLALVTVGAPTVLQAATCTTLSECLTLGNSACTGLPCCAAANVPAGSTCNKKGNGASCNCS